MHLEIASNANAKQERSLAPYTNYSITTNM